MITLEDVAMIFGLQTHGLPVTGSTDHSKSGLENECMTQFSSTPGPNNHKGSRTKLAWFRTLKRRQHLTDPASRKIYVKCHIMYLFGTTLFSDKSEITVHWKYLPLLREFSHIHKFSCGSACLAQMYRSLSWASKYDCKDMDGPLPLFLSVWDAYSPNRIVPHVIPFEINDGADLWSATVSLICFKVVERHPTDRVRRQFGFHQDPPVEPMKLVASHNIVLTGPKNKNWTWNTKNGSYNG
ncbi:uncharacterized protein DS421_8g224860 [Arachis hypogaea]|nr:uncharacterized protein DS421_8g224860 [Arachis hypogaea]